jgi:hypothetical protein
MQAMYLKNAERDINYASGNLDKAIDSAINSSNRVHVAFNPSTNALQIAIYGSNASNPPILQKEVRDQYEASALLEQTRKDPQMRFLLQEGSIKNRQPIMELRSLVNAYGNYLAAQDYQTKLTLAGSAEAGDGGGLRAVSIEDLKRRALELQSTR